MQPRLDRLGAYPFQRLKQLFEKRPMASHLSHINAGAGEPRLPLPDFVHDTLMANIQGFSRYPATTGNDDLREAICAWLKRRYQLDQLCPQSQVLSANGTREALFTIAHALINPEQHPKPYVLLPNPMYQIYLGAALTAGAEAYFLPCMPDQGFRPDLDAVPESVWQQTDLVYICSPSNPTGWIADQAYFERFIAYADRYDFHIVSDECYSEIYLHEQPIGLLQACQKMGRLDYHRCLVMNSLSKRSALPGLRSGLIAGDAALLKRFSQLRSYTGPATPLPLQAIAAQAWRDEQHVAEHLAIYQASVRRFYQLWGQGQPPDGGFFAWLPVADDEAFALAAYQQQAVTVLPGSYLAAKDVTGHNPGRGFVRAALVDGVEKAAELAQRLKQVSL